MCTIRLMEIENHSEWLYYLFHCVPYHRYEGSVGLKLLLFSIFGHKFHVGASLWSSTSENNSLDVHKAHFCFFI